MARPSKLTPERHAKIVQHLTDGAYARVAALANGVSDATYRRWVARGRDADLDDDGNPINHDDIPYIAFYHDVQEAEAKSELAVIARTKKTADDGTWQAAARYLERKYPDRWGPKDQFRQEASGRLDRSGERRECQGSLDAKTGSDRRSHRWTDPS